MNNDVIDYIPLQGITKGSDVDAILMDMGIDPDEDDHWEAKWDASKTYLREVARQANQSLTSTFRGTADLTLHVCPVTGSLTQLSFVFYDDYCLVRLDPEDQLIQFLVLVTNTKSLVWWTKQFLPTYEAFRSLPILKDG